MADCVPDSRIFARQYVDEALISGLFLHLSSFAWLPSSSPRGGVE